MTKNSTLARVARTALVALALAASASASHAVFAQSKPDAKPKKLAAGDYYTCVMHPDIRAKKPGFCPKCRMELRLHHDDHSSPGAKKGDASTPEPGATPEAPPAPKAAAPNAATPDVAVAKMFIPDVELIDQDGRRVHFYTDLVKGRTVAINFIFTTCTTICPPLGATFARVERELGERAGRDVRLISVSVDPATDTPERMKEWGAKFKAGAGWTLLTGAKPAVDELLRALGAQTGRPEDHSPAVLIGNDALGQWTRTYGLARPTKLVEIIDAALAGQLNTPPKESSRK